MSESEEDLFLTQSSCNGSVSPCNELGKLLSSKKLEERSTGTLSLKVRLNGGQHSFNKSCAEAVQTVPTLRQQKNQHFREI